MLTKYQEIAQANRRKRFGRAIAAGHAKRRAVADGDLASRNAYRVAAGLPLVTMADKSHGK